ncbi:MAG: hypothetical protein ACUVS2_16785, partial [Candidatus Flexifilum sp.]
SGYCMRLFVIAWMADALAAGALRQPAANRSRTFFGRISGRMSASGGRFSITMANRDQNIRSSSD